MTTGFSDWFESRTGARPGRFALLASALALLMWAAFVGVALLGAGMGVE